MARFQDTLHGGKFCDLNLHGILVNKIRKASNCDPLDNPDF